MINFADGGKKNFFDIVRKRKEKRLFFNAFFLSFMCHTLLFLSAQLLLQNFSRNIKILRDELIIVDSAPYIPFPEPPKVVEEKVPPVMPKDLKTEPLAQPITKAKEDSWIYKKSEMPDMSWRSKVAKLTERSNILSNDSKKIEVVKPKEKDITKNEQNLTKEPKNYDVPQWQKDEIIQSYGKKLKAVVRNHWNVPEDLALKYGQKPVEVEIEIDSSGQLKNIKLKSSSGNKIYDNTVIEAIKRSFPFLPPPKEFFQTSFQSAIIILVFYL